MSSIFWNYFKKTLQFILIQKAGPLAQMTKGGALALDKAREDDLWLRDQFMPGRCDDEFLANFAKSRGIVRAPQEPEEYYQNRIRMAYIWYILGGRDDGMEQAMMNYFGFTEADVINLRNEDPERWAEFRVKLNGVVGDILDRLDQVEWAVNEVKPARSKLAELELWLTFAMPTAGVAIGMLSGPVTLIYPYIAGEIEFYPAGPYVGPACLSGQDTTIYPYS